MAKPIVGITGYHVSGEEGFGGNLRGLPGQGFSVVGHDYIQAVQQVGGVAFGLPVTAVEDCSNVVASIDALIITGGEDVNPRLYGKNPDVRCSALSPERDTFEMALIGEVLRQNKPVLCICRGLQILNVYFGGTLYLDITDHSDAVLSHQFDKVQRWYAAHTVQLTAPALRRIYGASQIEVNSYHHQAVERVGEGLQVGAVADDGIVEALVHPDLQNLLAVQWHPEMMAARSVDGLIPFRWLLDCTQS